MATPLDPDRWNEFSKPVPPSPAARRERHVDREKYAQGDANPKGTARGQERSQSRSQARTEPIRDALVSRRVVVAGGAGALGLVAVLALMSGGASASSPEVAAEPAISAAATTTTSSADPVTPSITTAPTSAATTVAAVPVSWAGTLAELDVRRQQSFAAGDAGALGSYAKAGSPAATGDAAAMKELSAMGARAKGMSSKILTVKVLASTADSADLEVADELSSYDIVRSDTGAAIESRPARGAATWRVRLERVNGQWLLVDSRAAS